MDAEISLYEQEKAAIKQVSITVVREADICLRVMRQVLPRMLHELSQLRASSDAKQSEINIYDKAIEEIESTYGHILFTPEFYNS